MFERSVLRIQDAMTVRMNGPVLPRLREWLDPRPGMRLLDVGGGTGVVTALLADGMGEAVVLEPERSRLSYGQERRKGLRFVESGAEAIPFPDASFDRVLAHVSLHHVPDLAAALREIRRVLAPPGRLVVREFDPESSRGRWVALWENDVRHLGCTFYAPSDLKQRLEACGFRDVAVHPLRVGHGLVASL